MSIFIRTLENQLKEKLFQGKVVILYGARQVGKTTLAKKVLSEYGEKGRYLNCENLSVPGGVVSYGSGENESVSRELFLGGAG